MKHKWLKSTLAIIVLAGISALIIVAFMKGHNGSKLESEQESRVKALHRVSTQGGETVITIDKATRIKSAIVVTLLKPVSHQEEIRAYGMVLELQSLVDLHNSYAVAKAQLEKDKASLESSSKAYERLKILHEDNRNISDKNLQTAQAIWRSDEANVHAAQETLNTLYATVQQQWGDVIFQWMSNESPSFERLVKKQDILIQITLPSDTNLLSASQTALVQALNKTLVTAKFLSQSPHTDSRIQGMSFFYIVPVHNGLLPGMNMLAYLQNGPEVTGVVVPASAVVWLQGKAWLYLQKNEDHFIRREISTETPVKDGWFVSKGLLAGDRIVVGGAQLLLSEEFSSQIQTGE